MEKSRVQLAELVDMTQPAAVFEEVKSNFVQHYHILDFNAVRITFKDFTDLYEGRYPGYRACNTKFHDQIHTTDALLAMSRLIDGYNLTKPKLPVSHVQIALMATIMHDTGYIQNRKDKKGTGAKYTLNHVERSIDFLKKYFGERCLGRKELGMASRMINCTGLNTNLSGVKFSDNHERTLGFMLGAADLLGQMASRTYLERLVYLYREFREGHVKGYNSEHELLEKTLQFYEGVKYRLKTKLEGVDRYLVKHFNKRYQANEDLYDKAINRQISYLKDILANHPESFKNMLRRQI